MRNVSAAKALGLCCDKQGCSVRSGRVAALMWVCIVQKPPSSSFFLFRWPHCKYQPPTNNSAVQNRLEEDNEGVRSAVDTHKKQQQHDLLFSVREGYMLLFLIILTERLQRSSWLTVRGQGM